MTSRVIFASSAVNKVINNPLQSYDLFCLDIIEILQSGIT